ncbi:hypothetical protein AAGG74_17345 [Bacillus mexicanus]|uniref:hypothetical protein n=1 Tax=Bacillus mexicanus TaxID=2834415 RepID=UPI003D19470A
MEIKLAAITNLKFRAKRIHNRFDFKTTDTMKKIVSPTNALDFEGDIESMLIDANELVFIALDDNRDYANEIFKKTKKLLIDGSKIILNKGSNREMSDLVLKESQDILDLLYVIEENGEQFKSFIYKDKHFFDERWFFKIAQKIKLLSDVNIFFNELNGGNNAIRVKNTILNPYGKEIHLYGIDRDIDWGEESRNKGIETARGGIHESSSYWADICFCANHQIDFSNEEYKNTVNSEIYNFYREHLVRKNGGYFVFNYPYYRIDRIKHIFNNYELIAAINTDDELGNIIFVMKYVNSSDATKRKIKKIMYSHQKLPNEISFEIEYRSEGLLEVRTFRGKYVDLNDIKAEFRHFDDSASFLFNYYHPQNKLKNLSRPLIEYKPGHIPAMATSEIINGRYVDEVLEKKTGHNFGFDHLFSTKIVKRDVEEYEEKIDKEGNKITEISLKKSNIIVSIALTALGEYIELFSNENNE